MDSSFPQGLTAKSFSLKGQKKQPGEAAPSAYSGTAFLQEILPMCQEKKPQSRTANQFDKSRLVLSSARTT
jgi:hypothetical protein